MESGRGSRGRGSPVQLHACEEGCAAGVRRSSQAWVDFGPRLGSWQDPTLLLLVCIWRISAFIKTEKTSMNLGATSASCSASPSHLGNGNYRDLPHTQGCSDCKAVVDEKCTTEVRPLAQTPTNVALWVTENRHALIRWNHPGITAAEEVESLS